MTEADRIRLLRWTEPALPQAARLLVREYTADGVADLTNVHVVLPGAGAGRRLKELLVEASAEAGVRLVPPRVVTLGQVPELLYTVPRPIASEAVSRLAWAAVLRRAPGHRLDLVFRRRPDSLAVHEWALLARELRRLHREVASAGHRFNDVVEICRAAAAAKRLSWNDADRWGVLSEIQHEYAAELDRAGFADRDLARLEAIGEGRLESPGPIWLIGVSEMPGVTRRALEGVGGAVRALVHATEDVADRFDALGCVIPERWHGVRLPLDEAQIEVVEEPGDQADAVARLLAGLDGTRAADEIVVGVPDAEVVPWIAERLTDAGVPVRDAAGISVQKTAPYRLLSAVADFLEGRRFEAFAALVRHPDVAQRVAGRTGGEGELSRPGGWLTALDEWYGDHLPARLPPAEQSIPGEGERRGPVVAALLAAVDDELLLPLWDEPAERLLSEWTLPVLELLETVYGARELQQNRLRDRRLLRALEILAGAVHALDDLPDGLDTRCTATQALRLILEEARGRAIPADPVHAAVELLGWLELHLDDAPVTVLTGVNEPRLPESVSADAFLPDTLRSELGLVDNRARYARDLYRLTALFHSTETLHLIAGRRSAGGDPLRPSRLLFATDPETVARRVVRFYGEEEGTGDPGAAPGPEEASTSDFRLPPEPEIRLTEPIESLRVTDFSAILADPYRWALERVRGCSTLADDAREMDGLLFGSLAHNVLQDFGSDPELIAGTDPARLRGALDKLLDARVVRRFGREMAHTYPAVRLQVEQLRARLHRFADWHADWIASGWEVKGVEVGTPKGGVGFEVDGRPLGLRARLDRVDHHPETGRWAVLDYKTSDRGETPERTHRKGRGDDKEWVDLQLPLYRWLLPRVTDDDGRPRYPQAAGAEVDVGYVLLPRSLDDVGESLAEWDAAAMEDALETARDVVRVVREGVFTFAADRKPRWPDEEMESLLGLGQLLAAGTEGDDE
jgi:hypothetical protein